MNIGTDFYAWNPNFLQAKDPGTNTFVGNVVGNTALADQLKVVTDEGARQKAAIRDLGGRQASQIQNMYQKYVRLWQISDEVVRAILGSDPEARTGDSEYVENWIRAYLDTLQNQEQAAVTPSESSEPEEPLSAEYYQWHPNVLSAKLPNGLAYYGNVIGNVPLNEQLQVVTDEGGRQKASVTSVGAAQVQDIRNRTEKYRTVTSLNAGVMKEIIQYFGGVFFLDTSRLDTDPLG